MIWKRFLPALLGLVCWVPGPAAQTRKSQPPRLVSGMIEVGVAGSWTRVEDQSRAVISLRGGVFGQSFLGLIRPGVDISTSHQGDLDLLDLEAVLHRFWGVQDHPVYIATGLAGGIRQEWLGSFRTARFPVGIDLGVYFLASEGAGLRIDYRLRRILSDPVADFTEHRILLGISLLLNRPAP